MDLIETGIERGCHQPVHRHGIAPLDEIGNIPVPTKQVIQFVMTDPSQDGGIGDLVPIQMKDGENHTVCSRVEKLVGMPARGERTGLRFAISHHTGCDQIWIVEHRAVGMRERVA